MEVCIFVQHSKGFAPFFFILGLLLRLVVKFWKRRFASGEDNVECGEVGRAAQITGGGHHLCCTAHKTKRFFCRLLEQIHDWNHLYLCIFSCATLRNYVTIAATRLIRTCTPPGDGLFRCSHYSAAPAAAVFMPSKDRDIVAEV